MWLKNIIILGSKNDPFFDQKNDQKLTQKMTPKITPKMMSKNGQNLDPQKHQKMAKNQKTPKMSKNHVFHVFQRNPQKRSKTPPGGWGGPKRGSGGSRGSKKGGPGGSFGGVPGGSVLGVSRRKRLENGGKPYSSQGSPKGFLGENRPKLSRGPPKFTDVSRENDHFPWKDFPISPCGKIRRQVPKKPNENPGTGGSKNVPLLEGPPTRFCWGTFFFYRPPKPPFPLEDLCRRNARKGVFRFLDFLLQPGLGKNAKKAPHQNL